MLLSINFQSIKNECVYEKRKLYLSTLKFIFIVKWTKKFELSPTMFHVRFLLNGKNSIPFNIINLAKGRPTQSMMDWVSSDISRKLKLSLITVVIDKEKIDHLVSCEGPGH